MKTIVIAHQKGGVGKSTIALNLAYALKRMNNEVAIKDMDKQGTLVSCAQTIPVFTTDDDISTRLDYLIVDTPPYLTSDYLHLFTNADIVIIPTRASIADALAIRGTIELLEEAKFKSPGLKGVILYNAIDTRTSMYDLVNTHVEEYNLPILETKVRQRVSYSRSLLDDEGIFSEDDKMAHQEITDLTREILTLL